MDAKTLATIYGSGALMTLAMTLLVLVASLGVALYCSAKNVSGRAARLFSIAWAGFMLVSIIDFVGRYILARMGYASAMEWLLVSVEIVNIGFGVVAAVAMFLFKPQAAAVPDGKNGKSGKNGKEGTHG